MSKENKANNKSKAKKYWSEFAGIFKHMQQHLMNGVSYMIPVVVAGGIMFALATMMVGPDALQNVKTMSDIEDPLAKILWAVGKHGLSLMVIVLSAYIAESIADRPGIAPGLIGGFMCVSDMAGINAGFIGGIFAGIIAGISAYYLKKIPLPKAAQSLKAIIIVPLLASFITGFLIIYVIGTPCAWLLDNLTVFLESLSNGGAGAAVVGAVCGAMIAFDMGGPVNKVAYSVGAAMVGTSLAAGENCAFMGPIGIAICIPPIGCGLASLIFKNKFTAQERSNGLGSIIMGCCGITEGAIPYATADPLRVIPINMVSSAIAGAVAGAVGAWSNAAWGGLIVLPVTNMLPYFLCIVLGVAVHVVLCGLLKRKKKDIKTVDKKQKTPKGQEASKEEQDDSSELYIIGVTACPSGVAHTYMGAEAIKAACENKGIECKIETQGSIGVENKITDEDVERATACILSTNMPIKEAERFDNLEKIENDLGYIIKNADSMIDSVISKAQDTK